MDEPTQRYVMANDITQANKTVPPAMQADVWVSGVMFSENDDAEPYVSLEVKPAWGTIAAVRFSLAELQSLGEMILDRLGAHVIEAPASVELSVPESTQVKISYT